MEMSAQANKLALDLEELIPAEHRTITAIGTSGVIADLLAIVADVKAKNWTQAALDFAKLLQDLAWQSQAQAAALGGGKINWGNILAILGQLLPIILGGLKLPVPTA
jgi:hypothetical protein